MKILEVKYLKKYYGKGDTLVKALDGVSFSVNSGEFIAIVGASGSGKSTLLHLIGGVDKPTSGKIIVDDEDIYKLSENKLAIFRRRKIGLIYQFYNLLPILNVVENITLPVKLDNKKVDEEHLDEIIKVLGMDNKRKNLPNQLSGGEQQRASIGRALITRPSIILADEPTGNLDSKSGKDVMELLTLSNKKFNQTIIMITHDMEVAKYADRIITIADGKIISDERVK